MFSPLSRKVGEREATRAVKLTLQRHTSYATVFRRESGRLKVFGFPAESFTSPC